MLDVIDTEVRARRCELGWIRLLPTRSTHSRRLSHSSTSTALLTSTITCFTHFQHCCVFLALHHTSSSCCSGGSTVLFPLAHHLVSRTAVASSFFAGRVMDLSSLLLIALLVLVPARCGNLRLSPAWGIPLTATTLLTNQSHQCQSGGC